MSGTILLLLGFVFGLAGAIKLLSPEQFRDTLRKLLGARLARPLSAAVPVLELALAVWLLGGVAPREAAAVSILVLLLFSAALLRIWRRGLTCGCFGEAGESAPSGLVRNVILIVLAATVALPQAAPETPWSAGAGIIIGRVTVVIGAACLWACLVALFQQRKFVFSSAGA
jgi:uncharacterized membrane protein YphA (DoxX/SURF4 family)